MENLDTYLELYYKSLSSFLEELGGDLDTAYPFKTFMDQWKKFGKFGLAMILFGLTLTLSEEHEAPSLASKEEFAKSLNIPNMVNQEEHDTRIINIFKKFVRSGWV